MAAPALAPKNRDLVAVGASAGGIEALPRLLTQLPPTFPASVLIAIHQARRDDPHLVHILQRATVLPVGWAEQGERVLTGRVYVGPPDMHLTVAEGHIRLSGGPRENFFRPAIDRLFRSCAADCGSRTVGVLLTGMMGDGITGLMAIRDAGGKTIVQDPTDAQFSELPARAIAAFNPDAKLRLDEMGSALVDMTQEIAPDVLTPIDIVLEAEIDRLGPASPREMDQLGKRVQQICPECGGPLWEVGAHGKKHWRCYLGHAVTARNLLERADEQVEAALWSAIRALHERAATWDTLATDARDAGRDLVADDYAKRAQEAKQQAEVSRKFMLDLLRHRH